VNFWTERGNNAFDSSKIVLKSSVEGFVFGYRIAAQLFGDVAFGNARFVRNFVVKKTSNVAC